MMKKFTSIGIATKPEEAKLFLRGEDPYAESLSHCFFDEEDPDGTKLFIAKLTNGKFNATMLYDSVAKQGTFVAESIYKGDELTKDEYKSLSDSFRGLKNKIDSTLLFTEDEFIAYCKDFNEKEESMINPDNVVEVESDMPILYIDTRKEVGNSLFSSSYDRYLSLDEISDDPYQDFKGFSPASLDNMVERVNEAYHKEKFAREKEEEITRQNELEQHQEFDYSHLPAI